MRWSFQTGLRPGRPTGLHRTSQVIFFRACSSSPGRGLASRCQARTTNNTQLQRAQKTSLLRCLSSKVGSRELKDGPGNSSGSARPSGLRLLDKKRQKKDQGTPMTRSKDSKSTSIFGQDSSLPIRARFAPSPTGYMHLGSLHAEQRLIADLKWAGLKWDEGPDCGGPHGPYRQSDRLEIYKEHAQRLLDQGHAYRCFCSQEQLDAQKLSLHEAGQSTAYPKTCRSISTEESDARAAAGEAHLLRFKGDSFGRPKFRDAIFGLFQKGEDEEDFVILKTDGYPTYHLANVIDDHLMKITHVIRGEEWLISTPKHIALYNAFAWQPPIFAHLALLVNPDGSKLSKRQNARGISDLREGGVPPMPLVTWLISLGGGTQHNKIMANHPRDIPALSHAMQYNSLKRVPIRVTHDQLASHQLAYARTLATKYVTSEDATTDSLRPHEVDILEEICRSFLRKATNLQAEDTGGPANWPHPLWNEKKELLIPLGGLEEIDAKLGDAASSLYHLLSLRQIPSLDPDEVLGLYPYFVWQVPEGLYKASLTRWKEEMQTALPVETISQLQRCLQDQSCQPQDWMAQLRREDKQEMAAVYSILRLLATGVHDQASPPASTLFLAISRADWSKRVRTVQRLIQELEH
ncbi:hypothetical protein NLU13_4686 [Sarocladium strictum]|uniref:Glutamyl/glutaminyl-tRNA synthetase class Ib catalytic domain-containing protein n=1 Tax=Sarocladium strictum TaxID=5046 RepID=A0AA39L8W4_SARSR|nr:hypothetical protein NLU13_4686 [Sarocladium strictum]